VLEFAMKSLCAQGSAPALRELRSHAQLSLTATTGAIQPDVTHTRTIITLQDCHFDRREKSAVRQ
jgi:hypothetical protein